MRIDLSNFFRQDEGVLRMEGEVEVEADGSTIDFGEYVIDRPITYKGEIHRTGYSYLVTIHINYSYKAKCARCLVNISREMETTFNGKIERNRNKEEEDGKDLEVIYLEENELDVAKYVLMEVASSLPMRVLCDEDCKGICPQCGKNLNEDKCDCVIEDIDPRLEKLKDFFTE